MPGIPMVTYGEGARAAYGNEPVVDGDDLVVAADGPAVDIWVWSVR